MYLKRTSPFNEKSRTRGKKKSADKLDHPHKRLIKFTLDIFGHVKGILTKSGKEVILRGDYNKWDLLEVQNYLLERGAGETQVYKDICAEIQLRITEGKITPTDIASKAIAKEEVYG